MIEDNKWYEFFEGVPWLAPVAFVAAVLAIAGVVKLIGLIF